MVVVREARTRDAPGHWQNLCRYMMGGALLHAAHMQYFAEAHP